MELYICMWEEREGKREREKTLDVLVVGKLGLRRGGTWPTFLPTQLPKAFDAWIFYIVFLFIYIFTINNQLEDNIYFHHDFRVFGVSKY